MLHTTRTLLVHTKLQAHHRTVRAPARLTVRNASAASLLLTLLRREPDEGSKRLCMSLLVLGCVRVSGIRMVRVHVCTWAPEIRVYDALEVNLNTNGRRLQARAHRAGTSTREMETARERRRDVLS